MAAQEKAVADDVRKTPPQLAGARMKPADYERTVYLATAPAGTEVDDILNPAYWSVYAAKLKPYDRIEVRCEDNQWWAELMVLDCTNTWAKVRALRVEQLAVAGVTSKDERKAAAVLFMADYEVQHRGPRGWSVVRKSDRAPVFENGNQKGDAEKWLEKFAFENAPAALGE